MTHSQQRTSVVAANVRAEAARRNQRQVDLAAVLGVTQPAISRRLAGEIEFSVAELQAIATHLGVSTALLLGEESVAAAS
ncbi:helix-turn-helix transcriptional regulator [Nocardioides sp. SOB77]|uniref:Helix-turn-helix transcriptional regulator n=1 Tax=Nocardioides oceani TaxID=3058369 RepID=A0ABT8FJ36_9ACTN|nr:helix-turn-helix transcriptional regulator [Nocardioides oceani]MDN4174694.1 helix-turn-helix transcriptional regulator [Nocardioides oceani]